MSSRDTILAAVLTNQPPASPLPDITSFKGKEQDTVETYCDVFTAIGGRVFLVESLATVEA